MNQTNRSLGVRGRLSALSTFVSRHLTLVSLSALVLGLLLVVAGPVRMLVASLPANTGGKNPGVSQAESLLPGIGLGGASPLDLVERQPVPYTTIPDRPRRQVIGYTVKTGDTLFGIAGEFGLKPETLFWSNKATLNDDVHLLMPGVTLAILPQDGVYTTADGVSTLDQIVSNNNGDLAAVLTSSLNALGGYTGADVPPWGMKIAIPGGHRDIVSWAPATTAVNQTVGGKTTVVYGYRLGMPGSCAPGIKGGGGTTAWITPISPGSYTITQGFAPWHSGIDMAANVGTPVHAADTGVVIFSGWDETGYGNLVVLDHGNGWITYYGHLNSRAVGCGQTVQRGGPIGTVGTTGHSTGPHLHFETRWQDRPNNPAQIIGF